MNQKNEPSASVSRDNKPCKECLGCAVPRLITSGEGRHCTSTQPAELLTALPAALKHPLTRRGLLETSWLFFFFLTELSVQKSTEDYRNRREQNGLLSKISDFSLFQVSVMISVFCNHFINCSMQFLHT